MNRLIPRIGAAIVAVTVFLFALFMIVDFPFGSYLVCMFLPLGYIMMALSTFFIGFSMKAEGKADKFLPRGHFGVSALRQGEN